MFLARKIHEFYWRVKVGAAEEFILEVVHESRFDLYKYLFLLLNKCR